MISKNSYFKFNYKFNYLLHKTELPCSEDIPRFSSLAKTSILSGTIILVSFKGSKEKFANDIDSFKYRGVVRLHAGLCPQPPKEPADVKGLA